MLPHRLRRTALAAVVAVLPPRTARQGSTRLVARRAVVAPETAALAVATTLVAPRPVVPAEPGTLVAPTGSPGARPPATVVATRSAVPTVVATTGGALAPVVPTEARGPTLAVVTAEPRTITAVVTAEARTVATVLATRRAVPALVPPTAGTRPTVVASVVASEATRAVVTTRRTLAPAGRTRTVVATEPGTVPTVLAPRPVVATERTRTLRTVPAAERRAPRAVVTTRRPVGTVLAAAGRTTATVVTARRRPVRTRVPAEATVAGTAVIPAEASLAGPAVVPTRCALLPAAAALVARRTVAAETLAGTARGPGRRCAVVVPATGSRTGRTLVPTLIRTLRAVGGSGALGARGTTERRLRVPVGPLVAHGAPTRPRDPGPATGAALCRSAASGEPPDAPAPALAVTTADVASTALTSRARPALVAAHVLRLLVIRPPTIVSSTRAIPRIERPGARPPSRATTAALRSFSWTHRMARGRGSSSAVSSSHPRSTPYGPNHPGSPT